MRQPGPRHNDLSQSVIEVDCASQGIGVPPHPIDKSAMNVRVMLLHLFRMGVPPNALLLPRRPGQGTQKLCQLESLEALVTVLTDVSEAGLSPYKEVMRLSSIGTHG